MFECTTSTFYLETVNEPRLITRFVSMKEQWLFSREICKIYKIAKLNLSQWLSQRLLIEKPTRCFFPPPKTKWTFRFTMHRSNCVELHVARNAHKFPWISHPPPGSRLQYLSFPKFQRNFVVSVLLQDGFCS